MKRSSVLKTISGLLAKNSVHLPLCSDEIAEVLLFEIERLGMLPPEISRNLTEVEAIKLSSDSGVNFTTQDVITDFCWEDENENI